jgi:hypothetical protein
MTMTHASHTLNAQLRRFVAADPVGVLASPRSTAGRASRWSTSRAWTTGF